MTNDVMILGKRIRFFRAKAGLTLEQLGEAVGLLPSQLSQIENGRREPKLSSLTAMAAALGVALTDLLTGEAPDRRSELEIEALFALEPALGAEQQVTARRGARGDCGAQP